jgi:hypothetical protein
VPKFVGTIEKSIGKSASSKPSDFIEFVKMSVKLLIQAGFAENAKKIVQKAT